MQNIHFVLYLLLVVSVLSDAQTFRDCLAKCAARDPIKCFQTCKEFQQVDAPLSQAPTLASVRGAAQSGSGLSFQSYMAPILNFFPPFFPPTSFFYSGCSGISLPPSSAFISGYVAPSSFQKYTELRYWKDNGCSSKAGNSISHKLYYEHKTCTPVLNTCLYKKFEACHPTAGLVYSYCFDPQCQKCTPFPLVVGQCLENIELACADSIPAPSPDKPLIQTQSSCHTNAVPYETFFLEKDSCLNLLTQSFIGKQSVQCMDGVATMKTFGLKSPFFFNSTNTCSENTATVTNQESVSAPGCISRSQYGAYKFTCPRSSAIAYQTMSLMVLISTLLMFVVAAML